VQRHRCRDQDACFIAEVKRRGLVRVAGNSVSSFRFIESIFPRLEGFMDARQRIPHCPSADLKFEDQLGDPTDTPPD